MPNNRIAILVLIFLANTGYGVILPGLALYAASLGSSYSIIGAMVSIYAAAQLITQIPVGKISDRLGRKRFIVGGFVGVTLAAVLYNFASQPWHFFALQTLGGLSVGCVWPPLLAQLTDETGPSERGRVMGIFNTVFFLGIGLGPLVGGFISNSFGFLAVFGLWAFIAGFGAVFGLAAFRETGGRTRVAASQTGPRPGKPVLLKEGALLSFMGACAMRSRGGFCTSFNNAILPLYAVALFSVPQSMIGALMFAHGIMLAVFNFPGGLVSDRFGRKWPPIYGSLVATAGVLWYSFPGGYWALLVAVALAGAGSAFATPALQALVGDVSNPSRRGEAFGYFQTSFYVGTVFGAAVFGFLADLIGLWWATLSWAGFSLALSLGGLAIRNTIARPEPVAAVAPAVASSE